MQKRLQNLSNNRTDVLALSQLGSYRAHTGCVIVRALQACRIEQKKAVRMYTILCMHFSARMTSDILGRGGEGDSVKRSLLTAAMNLPTDFLVLLLLL